MITLPPILVVEDDLVASTLVEETLRTMNVGNPCMVLRSAEAAVACLSGPDAFPTGPALVVLDVTLPGMSGLDLLRWLRTSPTCSRTPVVMVSGSDDPKHINAAYDCGVDAFLVKPVAYEALVDILPQLHLPWAILPRDAHQKGADGTRSG